MARSTSAPTTPPSAPSRATGRDRLLDTAEALFAEHGITGVSLRRITEDAGQRNASVVQYHFGDRAGLVRAVVDRHMAVVDADRSARLDALGADQALDLHETMRILVEPLAERLRTPSGRSYLRVIQHLVDMADGLAVTDGLAATNRSLARVSALLEPATDALPRGVRAERRAQTTSFLLRALADRAAALDGGAGSGRPMGHDLFVANLVDVLVAVLSAPPSPATRALVG